MIVGRHDQVMVIAFFVVMFLVIPFAALVWGAESRISEPHRPWRS